MSFETPFLWFTQTLNGAPKPWLYFKIDGLMVNAYEILQNKSANEKIRGEGIHEYTKFDDLIMMDSGGFLFMKKESVDVTPEMILRLYEDSEPNFGVILDHPLTPNLPYTISRWRRLKTLNNIKCMLKIRRTNNPELIPVVHGYSIKSINWYLKKLQEIGDFNIYGIGSLVPSVYNTKGAGGIYNIIRIISWVKKALPNKLVHVFGVGSTLTMHLMFYAGADSIDSSSWRTKAAFGAIQLPGIGDRHISPKKRHKKYTQLKREEIKILDKCECPACKKSGIEGLKESFTLRALHNAWVYQKEIEKVRKLVKDNEYKEYVEQTIGKTRFSKVLDIIKDQH